MSTTSHPLSWPEGFPRTPVHKREKGAFRTSYADALKNVVASLRSFAKDSGKAINDPVLSSNTNFMGDNPSGDPGVAVWFTWDGLQVSIPVDRYTTAAANLQAIHHILEARRTELRHGTLALVRATFQGFKALPSPSHWAQVLGVKPGARREEVDAAYRRLAATRHPDKGGSAEAMAELNLARERALRECQA
jgi:hypothetical protein